MPRPVVHAYRDEDVLVDIERGGEALREHIHDVIVRVRAVVEIGAEGSLPFLRLHRTVRIRGVINETFEIQFAHTCEFWADLEIGIREVTNAVGPFEKPNSRVEVGTDLPVIGAKIKPVGPIN